MAIAERVTTLDIPTRNGRNSEQIRYQASLHGWKRWIAMAKTPTTLPRWALFLSNGALIATVIIGAISFGKSAGRTEAALTNSAQVPQIQAQLTTLQTSINELAKSQVEFNKGMSDRVSKLEEGKSSNIALQTKVDALTSQLGSVWAVAESSRGDVKELKGTVNTLIQIQQQRKDDK